MASFGLIGYPLSHSFSQAYFKEKFDKLGLNYTYTNFPIAKIDNLIGVLEENQELIGLNVTIPYKESVISYCQQLSPQAQAIGAVNCIKITRNQNQFTLKGHNTDWLGFKISLEKLLIGRNIKNALVLGNGGSSKAVCYALKALRIEFHIVSRIRSLSSIAYEDLNLDLCQTSRLIINTTPLGMFPKLDFCPDISYSAIGKDHICYDLIYNPSESLFLTKSFEQGATIKNGLELLEIQAEQSWGIWNMDEPELP